MTQSFDPDPNTTEAMEGFQERVASDHNRHHSHHGLFVAGAGLAASAVTAVGAWIGIGGSGGESRSSVATTESVPGTSPTEITIGSTVLTSTTEKPTTTLETTTTLSPEEAAKQKELSRITSEADALEDNYNTMLGKIDGAKAGYNEAKGDADKADKLINDDDTVIGDKDLKNGPEKDALEARITDINTRADNANSQLDNLPIAITQQVVTIENLVAAGDVAGAQAALDKLKEQVSMVDGLIKGAPLLVAEAEQLVGDCQAALDRQSGNGGSGSGGNNDGSGGSGSGGNNGGSGGGSGGGGTPPTTQPRNCHEQEVLDGNGNVIAVILVCD